MNVFLPILNSKLINEYLHMSMRKDIIIINIESANLSFTLASLLLIENAVKINVITKYIAEPRLA